MTAMYDKTQQSTKFTINTKVVMVVVELMGMIILSLSVFGGGGGGGGGIMKRGGI
jgi:hypothetical protein